MSKTDHPRMTGRHTAGSPTRFWKKDDAAWGDLRTVRRPVLGERQAVAEGLTEYREDLEARAIAEDGFGRECSDSLRDTLARRGVLTHHEPVQHRTETPRKLRGMAMVAALPADAPAGMVRDISWVPAVKGGKRRAAKQPFSRLTAPAFDPALVAKF